MSISPVNIGLNPDGLGAEGDPDLADAEPEVVVEFAKLRELADVPEEHAPNISPPTAIPISATKRLACVLVMVNLSSL